jgi:hypothetical protein
MVESIRVGIITQAEGPHLEAYLRSLPTDQLESLIEAECPSRAGQS